MPYGDLDDTNLERVKSHVRDDGRVDINLRSIRVRANDFLERRHAKFAALAEAQGSRSKCKTRQTVKSGHPDIHAFKGVPRMNLAILITGSRGDVQPFIALGKTLQKPPYSHRVRICTHPVFKGFVEENGLEFFSIGGDPAKLMAYMVKNPGILPSKESRKAGDIHARRLEIAEMLEGSWRACTQGGDGVTEVDLGALAKDEDVLLSLPAPFVADAIIANPPSYAHIHIAEKLAIPLHIMFTMPWSPTGAFSHPLANVDSSKGDSRLANLFSYKRIDLLTWEGLADLINRFREKTLMLDPVTPIWGHDILPRLKVPFTYCWPEALIPKPEDWGSHITISGYWFLPLASTFSPEPALEQFLDDGPPPVYIGFGSIVVDDPEALTKMIFDAVKIAGVRALVSKGWGNVGAAHVPEGIFLLGNVPHDWLFPRCSAVVHHGGAGTTAIGISLGKPTVIVPFFGDQPWWAAMIHRAGAGPEAVAFKKLTAQKLADNITEALKPDMQARAQELAEKIKGEDGTKKASEAFHSTPQMQNLGCVLCPDRVAVWRLRKTNIQLSALAAAIVVTNGRAKSNQFKLVRNTPWHVTDGPQGPIAALIGTFTNTAAGVITDFRYFSKEVSFSSHQSAQKSETYVNVEGTKYHKIKSKGLAERSASVNLARSLLGHTFKAPVALFYNLANGCHNCPAVFLGDRTVRSYPTVTSLNTGLARSGKEFGFGLYDAVTGIVTQPYRGYKDAHAAQKSVAAGTAKGILRGVGCLYLKTSAAVIGLPGYTLKGLEREIERWWVGSDAFLHGESDIINKARNQYNSDVLKNADGRTDIHRMWEDSKGAGMGKRIIERRVWQGYREVKELRLGDNGGEEERKMLERWDEIAKSTNFRME